MNMIQDHKGNISSFRIVWIISVLSIIGTWVWVSIVAKTIQPFPLDGTSTVALFCSSAAKTFTETRLKD